MPRRPRLPARSVPPRVHGVNLVPRADQTDASPDAWTRFWTDFPSRWDDWIKPQIDDAAAEGWNAVRIIGTVRAVERDGLALNDYLAYQEQVAKYCRSKGMWYYACGGSQNDYQVGVDPSWWATVVGPLCKALYGVGNVWGIDLIQEVAGLSGTPAVAATYFTTAVAAARANAPNLAVTFSMDGIGSSAGFGNPWFETVAPHCDFLDFHVYYTPAGASDADAAFALAAGRPLILGEFGTAMSAGGSARTARVNAMKAVAERAGCNGSLMWAARPQVALTSNDWGAWDADGVRREDVLTPYALYANAPYRAYPLTTR